MIDAIVAVRTFEAKCSGSCSCESAAEMPQIYRPWWVCARGKGGTVCTVSVVLYTSGIVLMNIYYTVTAFIPGSTYAVFIAVSGQSSPLLDMAQCFAVVFTTVSHLISWWWVLRHARWRSVQLRKERGTCTSPPSLQLLLFIALAFFVLLVGNLLDPGHYSLVVNSVVWPVGGVVFFWFPFCVPIAQLAAEMEVAIFCLRGMETALQKALTEERLAQRAGHGGTSRVSCEMASEAYMDVYRLIESTTQRHRTVLPLQLGTLLLALLLNGWHLFIASASPTALTRLFDPNAFLHLSLSVVFLTLVLLLYVLTCGGRLRIAGMCLQRMLGQWQVMLPLCQQMEFCAPVVRVLGSLEFFNLTRVIALLFSYLTFYLIGVLRSSGVPIHLSAH